MMKKTFLTVRIKYLFLFILCVISIINAKSQSVEFSTGDKIVAYDEGTFELHSMDSKYLYAFRNHYEAYYVDVYDRDSLKRDVLIRIPLPSKDSVKYSLETLFTGNDTFRIFYSYFDKKNLAERLEMITFNRRGEKIGDTKLIDTSEGKNEKKAGSFSVINRKKFNEFLSYGFKRVRDTSYINIDHFDYSANKTRSQNFVLEDAEGYLVNSTIDDDCNLYRLTRSKRGNRHVKWSVNFYSPEADHSQIIELTRASSNPIFLSNFFKSFIDKQKRINLVTPYTLNSVSRYAKGLYIAQINTKNHSLIRESIVPFKMGEGNLEGDFSLSSCIPVAIIPISESGLKIVFESRLKTTAKFYGITVDEEYEIGNIITIDMDSSHAITDIHKIRKDQYSGDGNYKYTGFAILNHNNKSYFIYNELPENLQRKPNEFEGVGSGKLNKTVVIYTAVDSNKVKRKILINKEPDSGTNAIIPGSYISANDKSEIYLLRKIKKDVFLTKVFMNE
ncbi:MAG TPA: hypothetical protein VJY62_05105 [Bacteroidia bacterium]|nr:hypothetical protein [Bacteroidia bacterium]